MRLFARPDLPIELASKVIAHVSLTPAEVLELAKVAASPGALALVRAQQFSADVATEVVRRGRLSPEAAAETLDAVMGTAPDIFEVAAFTAFPPADREGFWCAVVAASANPHQLFRGWLVEPRRLYAKHPEIPESVLGVFAERLGLVDGSCPPRAMDLYEQLCVHRFRRMPAVMSPAWSAFFELLESPEDTAADVALAARFKDPADAEAAREELCSWLKESSWARSRNRSLLALMDSPVCTFSWLYRPNDVKPVSLQWVLSRLKDPLRVAQTLSVLAESNIPLRLSMPALAAALGAVRVPEVDLGVTLVEFVEGGWVVGPSRVLNAMVLNGVTHPVVVGAQTISELLDWSDYNSLAAGVCWNEWFAGDEAAMDVFSTLTFETDWPGSVAEFAASCRRVAEMDERRGS